MVPPKYLTTIPAIPAIGIAQEIAMRLLDMFALLTSDFWGSRGLWLATKILVPAMGAWFLNLQALKEGNGDGLPLDGIQSLRVHPGATVALLSRWVGSGVLDFPAWSLSRNRPHIHKGRHMHQGVWPVKAKLEAFTENREVVLELCPNGPIQEMVRNRRGISLPEVRRFVVQLCGAIKYMHARNVIHRDLKMGNLFLDKDLNVDITASAFGAASTVSGWWWCTVIDTSAARPSLADDGASLGDSGTCDRVSLLKRFLNVLEVAR
ncbi:MAG: hypothetical protein LQ346_008750 [Caloplaca aetnensis]|nr:MAG: hypothetical protein LQ346_008750 [Caloplaca aetnensis]